MFSGSPGGNERTAQALTNEQMQAAVKRDTKRRAYSAEWQRKYRKEHPDRVLASRVKQAIKLLQAQGYEVLKGGERV